MIENNRFYWSHFKTKNVTVRVSPKKRQRGLVFKINNMIDLGFGRQTITLDNVHYPNAIAYNYGYEDVAVPFRMGGYDFIYTSRKAPKLLHVNSLLSALYKEDEVEKIVPDILCPGDLLVFTQDKSSMKIRMLEALRVVKKHSFEKNAYQKSNSEYAL
ncbi:MAG: hypothetical protein GC137_01255 [Alphaproteobacteria bacterium]|nr:hypothetical protein [Alphaproteobacteria bacterium]